MKKSELKKMAMVKYEADYVQGQGWIDKNTGYFLGANYRDAYDRLCELNQKEECLKY